MIRYALGWLAVGTVMAFAVITALGGGDSDGANEVALPPVHETRLATAARDAHCRFRHVRAGARLNPPVDGRPGRAPARPGIYDRPQVAEALGGAVRRGIVVIQYRPGLPGGEVEKLRTLQRAVPSGTIVSPNGTAMPYEFAVAAYRRLLACERYSDRALVAARLFSGRYLGRGPDSR